MQFLTQFLLGAAAGYIIHDALQPTIVGKTLDKVALPADLFVSKNNTQIGNAA